MGILNWQEWVMVVSNLMFWQAIPLRTTIIYCCSVMTITLLKILFARLWQ